MKIPPLPKTLTRRAFLSTLGAAGAHVTMRSEVVPAGVTAFPKGKAKSCIMIWLGGGMSQIDTFDPKVVGEWTEKRPGSQYPSIPTSVPGVRVCEHLSGCAGLMDRMTIVRSVHHEVIDEHGAAVIRVHSGRPTSGTIQYPSIGSVIAHELGKASEDLPAYVVVGYPNIARDPGFLGAEHGYLYVTDTAAGPTGLARPSHVSDQRQANRSGLLEGLRRDRVKGYPWQDYDGMVTRSLRLAGPNFMNVFDLDRESADMRQRYGGEFGQRCLLARRLVERGVRFVEVSHNLNFVNGTGWDTHFEGQQQQHLLIRELDGALSALVSDLEQKGKLDDTLVVIGTEFGRPAHFDSKGGRGHHGRCFSLVLAGGSLKHQGAYGVTDELGMKIVDSPVSIPDFHATVYAALGINPDKALYDGDRPVPITDGGIPIGALFA
ncbi:MAG: DUF1501 domain-containing protein [Verrucomicrobiota bacterium]